MGRIRRFTIGNPINTEAVVQEIPVEQGAFPYFTRVQGIELKSDGDSQETMVQKDYLSYQMGPEDKVYGLGENVRGIDKRGWVYESNCSDDQIGRAHV